MIKSLNLGRPIHQMSYRLQCQMVTCGLKEITKQHLLTLGSMGRFQWVCFRGKLFCACTQIGKVFYIKLKFPIAPHIISWRHLSQIHLMGLENCAYWRQMLKPRNDWDMATDMGNFNWNIYQPQELLIYTIHKGLPKTQLKRRPFLLQKFGASRREIQK